VQTAGHGSALSAGQQQDAGSRDATWFKVDAHPRFFCH